MDAPVTLLDLITHGPANSAMMRTRQCGSWLDISRRKCTPRGRTEITEVLQ